MTEEQIKAIMALADQYRDWNMQGHPVGKGFEITRAALESALRAIEPNADDAVAWRWSEDSGASRASSAPAERKPLTEGRLMVVYMDFDRKANKSWNSAEYLLHFARAIEQAHGIKGEAS